MSLVLSCLVLLPSSLDFVRTIDLWSTVRQCIVVWINCPETDLLVHSFLSHRTQPDDDFDIIVAALKEQAQYWTLASKFS